MFPDKWIIADSFVQDERALWVWYGLAQGTYDVGYSKGSIIRHHCFRCIECAGEYFMMVAECLEPLSGASSEGPSVGRDTIKDLCECYFSIRFAPHNCIYMEQPHIVFQNININMENFGICSWLVVHWDVWDVAVNDQNYIRFSNPVIPAHPIANTDKVRVIMGEIDCGRA